VEDANKWVTEDSDAYHYDIMNMENEGGPISDQFDHYAERLKYMEENGI